MKLLFVTGISLFLFLLGCQTPPTKVVEQAPAQTGVKSLKDILKGEPAILDVRSPFEFNANHAPGAINVRWEDFSQNDPKSRGLLQTDLFAVARRLSLIGIDPDTTVLVLGKGAQGAGEEGRVAWTLKVLGVKNVMTVNVSEIRGALPREVPMTKNKPYWKPVIDESLWVDIKTFKGVMKQGKDAAALVSKPVVIDVRSSQEYSLAATDKNRFGAIPVHNIEWTEFFSKQGAPVPAILQKLQEKGISTSSTLYIISNHGVRSAAVVYALRSLGIRDVTNVAGGYEQLGYLK
jgi:thiosulfate/3-mercaptopyruvate sulfurtransferase